MKYTNILKNIFIFSLFTFSICGDAHAEESYEPVIEIEEQLQPVIQIQETIQPVIQINEQALEKQQTLKQQQGKNNTKQQYSRAYPALQFNMKTLYAYRYQAILIGLIILYLINYQVGKRSNASIVEKFYKYTYSYFKQNFAHIGFTKQNNQDPFVAQSANEMLFYASGRDNIDYLQMNISLRKRQDIIFYHLYELIYPDRDLITIDIPVRCETPLVFCLGSKKGLKMLADTNFDIKQLASNFDIKGLNQSYQLLCESGEVVDSLFDGNVIKKINQLQGLLFSIHYTDQKMFSEQTGHLRAVINASYKKPENFIQAFELFFYLIDKIMNLKLSANGKQKAIKARQAVNASKEKQAMEKHRQQLKKQKQDKKRKQEAWLKSLPADKQKREDQKRKKKQINKMFKGRSMKVM